MRRERGFGRVERRKGRWDGGDEREDDKGTREDGC
jgi:hypothetical protein